METTNPDGGKKQDRAVSLATVLVMVGLLFVLAWTTAMSFAPPAVVVTLGGSSISLAACRYAPRAFLMLVGGLTGDLQRSRQCAEMIKLQRKDAKDLPNYLADVAGNGGPAFIREAPCCCSARMRHRSIDGLGRQLRFQPLAISDYFAWRAGRGKSE